MPTKKATKERSKITVHDKRGDTYEIVSFGSVDCSFHKKIKGKSVFRNGKNLSVVIFKYDGDFYAKFVECGFLTHRPSLGELLDTFAQEFCDHIISVLDETGDDFKAFLESVTSHHNQFYVDMFQKAVASVVFSAHKPVNKATIQKAVEHFLSGRKTGKEHRDKTSEIIYRPETIPSGDFAFAGMRA